VPGFFVQQREITGMAELAYFHGVKLVESTDTPSVVRVTTYGATFVNGTAPDADVAKFPLNTPTLITSPTAAAALGEAGSLLADVLTVFAEGGSYVIVNRVAEGLTDTATEANLIGNAAQRTGLYAALKAKSALGIQPRVLITDGDTGTWIENGVVSIAISNGGSGYTSAPTVTIEADEGDDGAGATAVATVVNGKVTAITVTAAGENYELPPTVTLTGGGGNGALATANVGDVANAFVSALATICPQIRARAYIHGPNTTDADAVRFRNTINSDRILIIDPKALKNVDGVPVIKPMTPVFAGVRSRVVAGSEGVSGSVSNKIIRSIDGVARTVQYPVDSNYLNERAIATVINERGGFRTWGSRLATDNALWAFDSVRATADMVNEALEDLYFVYVDRKFTAANLKMLVEDGNAAMRTFMNNDDILGGRVWLSDQNTPDLNVQGNVFLNVEFEPVGLMEQIRLTTYRNIAYYQLLLDSVKGAIENGPLTLAA
jgi:phage tail sheath protein FI